VERRLAEARIALEVTDAARAHVAREGYDPIYGARPLRRAIQRLIENPLSKRILAGEFRAGSAIRIDLKDDEIVFEETGKPGAEPAPPRETAEASA
jgi:ATP-dependent Clp protease ATP-binding subunit ClpA